MRVAWIASLMLAVSALTHAAGGPPTEDDAAGLVGVWEVVKGPPGTPAGSTLAFNPDGQFESRIKGTSNTFTGRYRVEGDSLMLDPPGFPATIRVLNADSIVIVGITGPAEYRRRGAGAAAAAAMPRAARKSGGFSPGVQPRPAGAGGAAGWAVVTGGGKFSVEMPTRPNAEESGRSVGPAGEFDYTRLACEQFDSKVDYMVVTLEAPGEIAAAKAGVAIEQVRDDSADHVGSGRKLISEKPVRLGEIPGREFALKVNTRSAGPVNLLGRAFVKGNMVFLVMATSKSRNAGMPPEVDRFLDSFSLSEPPARVAAKGARGPAKPAARPLKGWGTEVDPAGDVAIEASGRSLTMMIPGTPHVLAPERDTMNAPRVVAPARGDFVATVRVGGAFRPGRESTVKGLSSRQAGGLLIWKDAGNYLVLQRRATAGDEDKDADQVVLEELVAGRKGVTHRQKAPEGAVFVRLGRKGGRIEASFSGDGRAWKEFKPVETTWAGGPAEVGVVAVNTSSEPHEVKFDDFTLKDR